MKLEQIQLFDEFVDMFLKNVGKSQTNGTWPNIEVVASEAKQYVTKARWTRPMYDNIHEKMRT